MTDTIFAVASGAGRAGVAVIRISGRRTGPALDALCGGRPSARRASLRRLRDETGEVLDQGLVLWFPGPASYTGEDCAELQVHGGGAVLDGIAAALVELGLRPAEPGAFTRRAFLNGRLDLTEAEGVADLVEAETAAQRRQALRQMEGALGALAEGWAARLMRALAQQEALIDFPDEDLPADVEDGLVSGLAALEAELRSHLADARRGERIRTGLVFAIVGPPNVGKSTLMNALAGREVAIVSPVAGTTRDALEARIVLAGVPVTLVDTAGLREAADPIEAEGVRRALARAADADLVLHLADPASPSGLPYGGATLRVATKSDLAWVPACCDVAVSAVTGAGMDALRDRLAELVTALTASSGSPPLTRARHRAALLGAADHLARAIAAPLPELRGEDLRLAVRALGSMTGVVSVEDILDSVFGQFCIGK